MVQEVPPGVPGPFSVYFVFSWPKPDLSFFTRPSVWAPAQTLVTSHHTMFSGEVMLWCAAKGLTA